MTDRNSRHEQLKSCLFYDLTSVSFLSFFFLFAFLLFRPRAETIYRMVVYTRAQQWRTKFVCQQATRSRIFVSAAILWDLSRSFHFYHLLPLWNSRSRNRCSISSTRITDMIIVFYFTSYRRLRRENRRTCRWSARNDFRSIRCQRFTVFFLCLVNNFDQ